MRHSLYKYYVLGTHFRLRIQSKAVGKCVSKSDCQNTHFGLWTLRLLLLLLCSSFSNGRMEHPDSSRMALNSIATTSNENVELNYRLRLKMFPFYLIRLYGRLNVRRMLGKFMRCSSIFRIENSRAKKKTIKNSAKRKETTNLIRESVVCSNSVKINLLFGLVLYMN